jgi:hypothetical protein
VSLGSCVLLWGFLAPHCAHRRKLAKTEFIAEAALKGEPAGIAEEKFKAQPPEEWLEAHPERVATYASVAAAPPAFGPIKASTPAAHTKRVRAEHEVDLDDVVDIHVRAGKKLRGYVSAVIHNKRGGFRPPDEIEITVNEGNTATQYEAPMNGQWTVVARKRDRSARADACREEVRQKLQRADPANRYEHLAEDLPPEMNDTDEPLWMLNLRREYDEPTRPCKTRKTAGETVDVPARTLGAARRIEKKRARDTREANEAYAMISAGGEQRDKSGKQRQAAGQDTGSEEHGKRRRMAENEWLPDIDQCPPSPMWGGSGLPPPCGEAAAAGRNGGENDTGVQQEAGNAKHPDTAD